MGTEDDAFLKAFEAATIPNGAFHHRDHIRLSWIYLRRLGREAGTRQILDGIRAFAAVHGAQRLYHETITRAWIHLVAGRLEEDPGGESFEDFVTAHPDLLQKTYLHTFFTAGLLGSEKARACWVEPDRCPLP
ncbi:MAG TPA: hypothetical protein VN083_08285 [Vicinamibacteria bacterium]|jgi:hypothetical protein|nr:hypothetical protein [Vicinamibacteria bacterium]